MGRISALILALTGLVVLLSSGADATCCGMPCMGVCSKLGNRCHGCVTSNTCCGRGACNIFCCNCDDGCKNGIKCWNCNCPVNAYHAFYGLQNQVSDEEIVRESMDHLDGIYASADVDQDDRLNYEETRQWLRLNKPAAYKSEDHVDSEFKKMDLNGDGFLTKDEVDPQYSDAARKYGPKG